VISGPSGAGKSSIVAGVLRAREDAYLAVTATTRPKRAGETEGIDRFVIGHGAFERLVPYDAFLEHAEVHGHRYGTLRSEVDGALAEGKLVILEIDVQGARSIRQVAPEATQIFILPPSPEVLAARLKGRGTETDADLAIRLSNAAGEVAASGDFDHAVVNENLGDAVSEVLRILEGTPDPAGPPTPAGESA
jgi:guanylate kinase